MRIGLPKKNSLNLKLMISRRTCRSGFGLAYLGLIALYFMGQCVNKHGTTYSIAEFCIRISPESAAKPQAVDVMVGTNAHYIESLTTLQTLFSALSSLALDLACIYIWDHEDLWDIHAPKFINTFL
ncbi:hypothetical protein F4823DRAFT_637551 [Ustulina deusta]|nr:hypothetical protein F4823DRAFT_637551 [Ustulina deusta]